jgi:hypothetical protein
VAIFLCPAFARETTYGGWSSFVRSWN